MMLCRNLILTRKGDRGCSRLAAQPVRRAEPASLEGQRAGGKAWLTGLGSAPPATG